MHLQVRGYSVFIDVEKLEAGKFEDKLIQSVQRARNFILVLSASALDKCMGDTDMKDWVHKVRRFIYSLKPLLLAVFSNNASKSLTLRDLWCIKYRAIDVCILVQMYLQ